MWLEFLATAIVFLVVYFSLKLRRPKGFPPGPPVIPVFGSLPFLPLSIKMSPTAFHDSLGIWAKMYGPIYSMAIGHTWIVVLNDHQSLKDAMVHQGADFAGRPPFKVEKIQNPYSPIMGVLFGTYGKQWKLQKKTLYQVLQVLQDRHSHRKITEEAKQISLHLCTHLGQAVDIHHHISYAVTNILINIFFDEHFDYSEKKFRAIHQIIEEALYAFFAFGTSYIPGAFLTPSYRQLSNDLTEKYSKLNAYIQRKVKERDQSSMKEEPRNLMDAYHVALRKNPDLEDHLIQNVSDMFKGSVLTTTNTLIWCIYFMIAHPEVQEKVQAELDRVSGKQKPLSLADLAALPYTEATLLEVLRLSCAVPIAMPHATITDTTVGGFFIPKNTVVYINIWHIHHDPDNWEHPLTFKPTRFLDDDGNIIRRQDIVPFALGIRSCLGKNLAWEQIFLLFTKLMQDFSFSIPDGDTLPPPVGKMQTMYNPPNFKVFLTKRC